MQRPAPPSERGDPPSGPTSPLGMLPSGVPWVRAPLTVHPSAWLIVWVVALPWLRGGGENEMAAGLTTGLLALLSVVMHEMGHAVAARAAGAVVTSIRVDFRGGVCTWHGASTPAVVGWVALAGPAVSGALALSCAAAAGFELRARPEGFVPSVARMVALLNLAWLAWNLIPLGRSDGAMALDAVARARHEGERGERLSAALRRWAMVVVCALAFAKGWWAAGFALALASAFGAMPPRLVPHATAELDEDEE